MMWSSVLHVDIQSLAIFVLVFLLFYYLVRKEKNHPPGPRLSLPIFGNMLQFVGKEPLAVFKDMRRKYGDIFSLYSIGNELIVVLNGYSTVREALVTKARVFSDRPVTYLSRHMCKNKGLILQSGKFWYEQRHFTMDFLKEKAFTKANLENQIMKEMNHFVNYLETNVENAVDLSRVLLMCLLNVITDTFTNTRFEYDDPEANKYLDNSDEIMQLAGFNGPFLSNYPILKYCPGDPLKTKEADRVLAFADVFVYKIINRHLDELDENSPKDYVDHYLLETKRRSHEKSNFTIEQLRELIGNFIGAGSDTTSATVSWIIWHLQHRPDVQKKVQEEIQNAIGSERTPILQDQPKMPYVQAVIMEVLRISHPAPLSVPHATNEDIVFRGYSIPKGTMVLANLQSIFTDPDLWENPDEFRPERFMDFQGNLTKKNEFIPFSMGKRICMGEVLARAELFLITTSIYQKFSLLSTEGERLKSNDGILGITFHPKPFKVQILKGLI